MFIDVLEAVSLYVRIPCEFETFCRSNALACSSERPLLMDGAPTWTRPNVAGIASSHISTTNAEKVSEGRQARPERFETRIYALVRAIDLTLGGRGRLAGRIGANPCPVCRERP